MVAQSWLDGFTGFIHVFHNARCQAPKPRARRCRRCNVRPHWTSTSTTSLGLANRQICYRYRGKDCLRVGVTDLSINEDFTESTSEIESSFGLGYKPQARVTREFLAGKPEFEIERLEMWAIVYSTLLKD